MPSPRHDALVQLFEDRPQLAVEILCDLMGAELPDTPLLRLEKNTFNTRNSDDIEPDVVVVMGAPQTPAHAIVVEVQQDKSKLPRQLARYAAAVWLHLGCDVTVLVICPEQGVAAYYARTIESGLGGYRPTPWVLGPDGIPVIVDPKQAAAQMALSAMSVMVHGRNNRKVVEAFADAFSDRPNDHSPKYYEYAYSMSSPEIRRLMEEIMSSTAWPVYSPFARAHYGHGKADGKAEGIAEGKAEGKAESVLAVLAARGIEVPEEARARITSCTDLAQLETWVAGAAIVQSIDDLFGDEG